MAKYTIQLRTMMNDPEIIPLLNKALSTYPLYSPETEDEYVKSLIPTREQLNKKLLNHYRRYEIGSETIAEFLEDLEITMCEIMPLYNQRFKSVEIMGLIDDPFGNVNVTETFKEERQGTSKSNDSSSTNSSASDSSETESTVNSNAKNVESETPQGNISVSASNVDNVTHADKISWNKTGSNDTASTSGTSSSEAESTSESSGETTETVEHTFTKVGNQGVNTYAHDMEELRKTFIDVTEEIITDKRVKELFMLVF